MLGNLALNHNHKPNGLHHARGALIGLAHLGCLLSPVGDTLVTSSEPNHDIFQSEDESAAAAFEDVLPKSIKKQNDYQVAAGSRLVAKFFDIIHLGSIYIKRPNRQRQVKQGISYMFMLYHTA
ncbi:hypothetical protein [Cohnella faecalis]|nr:hypothetical protein [Cohnella faecalis]